MVNEFHEKKYIHINAKKLSNLYYLRLIKLNFVYRVAKKLQQNDLKQSTPMSA